MVVEDGKNVVDASSRGDSPAPRAGLEDRPADFCAAAESVNEGNEAIVLEAEDRTGLSGEDAVVGAAGGEGAFGLGADVMIEVGCDAADRADVDWLIRNTGYCAREGVKVGVSAIDVEACELGRGCRTGLNGLAKGERRGCRSVSATTSATTTGRTGRCPDFRGESGG